jgi:hypothetical protein
VFEKAAGICHYCSRTTEWAARAFSEDLAKVDHVVPWEKEGNTSGRMSFLLVGFATR